MCAKWHAPSASATPWDGQTDMSAAERLVMEAHREAYDRLHDLDWSGDARFPDEYVRTECPRCGSRDIVGKGRDKRGLRRWRCNSCPRHFTPATGTIFEERKLPVSDWSEFLLEVFSYEAIAGITRSNRRSPTTIPYWLAKTFKVLEGVQEGVVLEGRVQADEAYYPIPLSEAETGKRGLKPGFSKNKICIAVSCEGGKPRRSTFEVCGRGKPSGERALAAYGPHIAEGSTLVHDKERSHGIVVRERKLTSEAYDSRLISKLPDKENPLQQVNRLCFLVKVFLDRHNGFDRSNMQDWLNLFSVMVNPPHDKMEKVAILLDRAMTHPVTLRYRDYYGKKGR